MKILLKNSPNTKQVVKARAKAKATTKVTIIEEPVETMVGETIIEEPIKQEKPKKRQMNINCEMS